MREQGPIRQQDASPQPAHPPRRRQAARPTSIPELTTPGCPLPPTPAPALAPALGEDAALGCTPCLLSSWEMALRMRRLTLDLRVAPPSPSAGSCSVCVCVRMCACVSVCVRVCVRVGVRVCVCGWDTQANGAYRGYPAPQHPRGLLRDTQKAGGPGRCVSEGENGEGGR
jgi:hypothetical protein